MRKAIYCLLLVCCATLACFAQDPTQEDGYKPYGSFVFGQFDSVNLMNLKLDLHIPIANYPQRGGKLKVGFEIAYQSGMFNYDFIPGDNVGGPDCQQQCTAPDIIRFTSSGGLYVRHLFGAGVLEGDTVSSSSPLPMSVIAPDGNHAVAPSISNPAHWYATDGSGYSVSQNSCVLPGYYNNTGDAAVSPGGVVSCAAGNTGGYISDPNGNRITYNTTQINLGDGPGSTLSSITDSANRTIPLPPIASGSIAPEYPGLQTGINVSDFSGCSGTYATVAATLWSLPAANGRTMTYKFCYAQFPLVGFSAPCSDLTGISSNLSGCVGQPSSASLGGNPQGALNINGNPNGFTYLQSIVLPDATTWTFQYDPTYGDLSQITTPTGGTITYTWTNFVADGGTCGDYQPPLIFSRAISSRSVDAHDGTGAHTWIYTQDGPNPANTNPTGPPYNIKVTNPDGTYVVHSFTGVSSNSVSGCAYYETATQTFAASGASLKRVDTTFTAAPAQIPANLPQFSLLMSPEPTQITTTLGNGQVSQVQKDYDQGIPITYPINTYSGITYISTVARFSDVTAQRDYDYGAGAPGVLLRAVNNTYKWQQNSGYLNSGLLHLISTSCVAMSGSTTCNPNASNAASTTTYGYDESGSPQGALGNQTSVSKWLNTTGQQVGVQTVYNSSGMPIQTKDANGNATTYSYDSTGMFLSTEQGPSTNGVAHNDYYNYDATTGLLLAHTDENGSSLGAPQHTTFYSYDIMGRDLSASYPDGGSLTLNYNGYPTPPRITVTKATGEPSGPIIKTIVYDGAGRQSQIQANSDPAGVDYVDTTYNSVGNVASVSNPYRNPPASGDPPYGLTSYTYDALGHKLLQCQPDNGSNSPCQAGSSYRQWSYNGNSVTFTDEAKNSWQYISDGLGRLKNVVEPGGLQSGYTYDLLDNLRSVTQAGVSGETPRSRSFVYDSLSRLTSATNPETGTIGYTYDANGNMLTKTDARGITTNYSYDALNRLTFKHYPDGSTSAFGYDGFAANGTTALAGLSNVIGRLSYLSNYVNADTYYGYDAMGRVQVQTNCLPDNCGNRVGTSAIYDLAGNMTDLTYPDGHHITQTWDSAGHLASSQLVDIKGTSTSQSYLQSASYFPDGSPHMLTLGNGVVQTIGKNPRLQVQSMVTSTPLAPFDSQPFLSHTYCYVNCATGGVKDNGNIWGITDTLNASQTQGFTYDNLNRITSFSLGGVVSQQYKIDSFGNMSPMAGANPLYTFNTSTNRINVPCAASSTPYDNAGNQTCDTDSNGALRTYSFDAESRISQIAMLGSTTPFETYTYGADSGRVRKDNANGTYMEYVYFNGQPIAEKDQSGAWTDYIYAGGKKIARIEPFDVRAHLSGTRVDGSKTGVWASFILPVPSPGYVVKTGDMLGFRMYQHNANGGISIGFTDGSNSDWYCGGDQNGDCLHTESRSDQWVNRVTNLGSIAAGKTISYIFVEDTQGAPQGNFDVMVADMAITSNDGTVTSIVGRGSTEQITGPVESCSQVLSSGWPTNCAIERVTDPNDFAGSPATVRYMLSDHLNSAQMEFASGGWPVWKGQFAPFGQELDTQFTANHYKFTGKERDAESGNDYFGARYYGSTIGRFMSPDWSEQAEPVPYAKLENPQSLNLYAYVGNNPLGSVDLEGHDTTETGGTADPCMDQGAACTEGFHFASNDGGVYNVRSDGSIENLAGEQIGQAQQQSSSTTGNSNPNAAAEQHQYDLVVGRVNKLLGTDDAADHIDPGGKLVGGNYEFSINNADKSDAAFRSSLNSALGEADGDKGAHGGLTPPTHRIGFSTSLHHDNDALHVDHFNGAKFPIGSLLHVIVDVGIGHLPYYGSNHAFSYSGVQ